MRGNRRLAMAAALSAVAALGLAACGNSSNSSGGTGGTTPAASANPAYDLSAVCPSTVVVQTDWNPESEHGGTYELVGPNPTIDAGKKRVTGELVAHGNIDTGVKIEVRA